MDTAANIPEGHLGLQVRRTCVLQAADELVAFSLEGRTWWSHKEHGFWLRAALRPAWLDSHFIFAGK